MTMSTVEVSAMTRATPTSTTEPGAEPDATPVSLLPDPDAALLSSGDVGAEFAAMAVENGEVERSAAREERQAEEARVDFEEAEEVHAIRAEASSMRVEAWVDAGITVGAQVVGSSSTTGVIAKAGKALADGYFSAAQKDDEANAKAFEGAAADAKSAADDAHDTIADANEYIKSALDFYQEYVTTRAQTLTVAAQRA
jgi:hypothetical protein